MRKRYKRDKLKEIGRKQHLKSERRKQKGIMQTNNKVHFFVFKRKPINLICKWYYFIFLNLLLSKSSKSIAEEVA